MTKEKFVKKLKDTSGVSIIIAMVAFLVVTMVSVVIVSAALTAAKTVHDDREAKQNMLYLTSAAKLIRSELEGDNSYITYEEECKAKRDYTKKEYYHFGYNDSHGWAYYFVKADSPIDEGDYYDLTPTGSAIGSFTESGICKSGNFKDAFLSVFISGNTGITNRGSGNFKISIPVSNEGEPGAETNKIINVDYVMFPYSYRSGEELISTTPYMTVFTLSMDGSGETLFMKMFFDINKFSNKKNWVISGDGSDPVYSDNEVEQRRQYDNYSSFYMQDMDVTVTYKGTAEYTVTRTVTIKWNGFLEYYNVEDGTN